MERERADAQAAWAEARDRGPVAAELIPRWRARRMEWARMNPEGPLAGSDEEDSDGFDLS